MAIPVRVISTIARASLGIVYLIPFKQGEHLEEDKYWDGDEGMYYAKGQMSWYLRKVRQNLPRGEGGQDRSPTPSLALDSGNPNRFRGSGDGSPLQS